MEGKRERLPVKGAQDPDIPAQLYGKTLLDWKREKAPAQGVEDSGISAQPSGDTHGGVAKGALGIGTGKRGRARYWALVIDLASVNGVMDSDYPPTLLDTCCGNDDTDTSETLAGKRERALKGRCKRMFPLIRWIRNAGWAKAAWPLLRIRKW